MNQCQRLYCLTLAAALLTPAAILLPTAGWSQIEEVIVTVRKREESLQDIPLSIRAFTAEELRRKGINNLNDLTEQTAGLVFDSGQTAQDTRVVIRGLSPTRGRQNLAFLLDGIDISSEAIQTNGGSTLVNPRYLDLERVEIVKGPHSALYGRAAFNGAIKYITKRPGDTWEGEFGLQVAEERNYQVNAALGGPVVDDILGLRATAGYWHEEGYHANSFTGEKLGGGEGYGVALSGVFTPTERLKFDARVSWSDDDWEQQAAAFVPYNTLFFQPLNAVQEYDVVFNPDDPNSQPQICGIDIACSPGTAVTQESVISGRNSTPFLVHRGEVPDGDDLLVRMSPNVRTGNDYPGTNLQLFRTSLAIGWELESISLKSWTGYTDADQSVFIDFDKFAARPDDMLFGSRNPSDPNCSASAGDCSHHHQEIAFDTTVTQFSQELRLATDFEGRINFTIGGQFWKEELEQIATSFSIRSSNTVGGFDLDHSPRCYDPTLVPFDPGTGGRTLDPNTLYTVIDPATGEQILPGEEMPIGPYTSRVDFPPGIGGTGELGNVACATVSVDTLQFLPLSISRPQFYAVDTEHWSAYGMIDFDLTETWRFSLEGRYTWEDEDQVQPDIKNFEDRLLSPSSLNPFCPDPADPSNNICIAPTPPDAVAGGPFITPETIGVPVTTDSEFFTPRVTLEWQQSDDRLLYVSYAKGIKPGGHARTTSGAGGFNPDESIFTEEKLDVFEFGAKTNWLDNSLQLNSALYFQDFTDKQVPTTFINDTTGVANSGVLNAGAAEIWGFELEGWWAATENWLFSLAYTYLDAEYTEFIVEADSANTISRVGSCDEVIAIRGADTFTGAPEPDLQCVLDLAGNAIEDVPEHSVNASIAYRAPLPGAPDKNWFAELDYIFQDERFLEQWNQRTVGAYSLFDFRVGLMSDKWEASLYIDNLLDDDTVRTAGRGPGLATGFFGDGSPVVRDQVYAYAPNPRVIGVILNYRFE
jgi:outer membrane receptor protein involved in Fe transport